MREVDDVCLPATEVADRRADDKVCGRVCDADRNGLKNTMESSRKTWQEIEWVCDSEWR